MTKLVLEATLLMLGKVSQPTWMMMQLTLADPEFISKVSDDDCGDGVRVRLLVFGLRVFVYAVECDRFCLTVRSLIVLFLRSVGCGCS